MWGDAARWRGLGVLAWAFWYEDSGTGCALASYLPWGAGHVSGLDYGSKWMMPFLKEEWTGGRGCYHG